LKILFLNPRLPFPLISGDRVKSYFLLKHLGSHHEVTLVAYYQGKNVPEEYVKEVEKLGVRVYVLPLSPVLSGINAAAHLLSMPLEVAYYTGRKFREKVDELLDQENFDLAISFFLRSSEYLKKKNIPKVLIAEDCRILYQQRSFQNSRSFMQKAVRLWEYLHLKIYEPKIVNTFDITTCVTNTDIENMRQRSPDAKFKLLTNGVDLNYYTPNEDFSRRNGILFTGKLDVYSNTMMANEIINDIFPKISEKHPSTVLTIAGAKAPKSLLLQNSDKIHIFSDLPDLLPYYQNARIFLHPHHGASGIQNKILEAMACGCCVVGTATGSQGIPAEHRKNIMIANSNKEMIEYALLLLEDDKLATEISENARKSMVEHHSWEAIFKQLDEVIRSLA